jgi:hypothetical protein
VRIPGGDLAPPRRRRYGGGYGRRRRRRNLRLVMAVLLVAVAAGAAYLLRQDDAKVPTRTVQQKPCTTAGPTATSTAAARPVVLPRPQQVRLALLNGTSRNGLAKTVGDQLAARGFVVMTQANAPAALTGPSQVAFGAGADPAAALVARWILGSTTVSNPRVARGTVQVTLGSAFQRLATPAEAAAPAQPTGSPTPDPVPSVCAS